MSCDTQARREGSQGREGRSDGEKRQGDRRGKEEEPRKEDKVCTKKEDTIEGDILKLA